MITIRHETAKDYPGIAKVNDLAFGRKAESKLIETLRNENAFIPELSIITEVDKNIVGHILFFPAKITNEKETHNTLTLAPMSVLPEFHKQSIGKLLVIYGLQTARNLGHKSVVVLGHPSYYPKFGFEPASTWNITSPFPAPDEAFMAIELERGCLEPVSGKVSFPSAFDEL